MGGAVAVVLISVVVAALGAEVEGRQHEETAAKQQHGAKVEPGKCSIHAELCRMTPACQLRPHAQGVDG